MCSRHLEPSEQTLPTPVLFTTSKRSFVQDEGQLLVAGVGDSRCMLGRVLPGGAVRAVALSTDHVPDNPGEAARVRLNGVSIHTSHLGPLAFTVMTKSVVPDCLSCQKLPSSLVGIHKTLPLRCAQAL